MKVPALCREPLPICASLVIPALFEGEKPTTILTVLGIVAFMFCTCVVVVTVGIVTEARSASVA